MALPHFGGQHYYCSICYMRLSYWKVENECGCGDTTRLVFNNQPEKDAEMIEKRKLYLRIKKLERINE